MKKHWIILIIAVVVTAFSVVVVYGIRNSRGVPVTFEEGIRSRVVVQSIDREPNLKEGIDIEFWDSLSYEEIDLSYQLMVLPWPKEVVPFVRVRAFHNEKSIYLSLEWPDESEDDGIDIGTFSDASAVMFPLDENAPRSTIMMGFMGNANIWQWKASQDLEFWSGGREEEKVYVDFHYPFEEEELFIVSKDRITSAVNDLVAARVATISTKESQRVEGRGVYESGYWRVVFKRSLNAENEQSDVEFSGKKNLLCAFAVWEGSNRDRGGRKSISDWVELSIQ